MVELNRKTIITRDNRYKLYKKTNKVKFIDMHEIMWWELFEKQLFYEYQLDNWISYSKFWEHLKSQRRLNQMSVNWMWMMRRKNVILKCFHTNLKVTMISSLRIESFIRKRIHYSIHCWSLKVGIKSVKT